MGKLLKKSIIDEVNVERHSSNLSQSQLVSIVSPICSPEFFIGSPISSTCLSSRSIVPYARFRLLERVGVAVAVTVVVCVLGIDAGTSPGCACIGACPR